MTKAVSIAEHSDPERVNWEELEVECDYWEQLSLEWKKERQEPEQLLAHREPLFYSEHRLKCEVSGEEK